MGLYFRKSVSVGPFRFNLSGAGLGMSVGVRGLRVGTGPRGNYIRAGRGGIYYQASLSPRKPRSYSAAPQPALPQSRAQVARPFDPTLGPFETVDAGSSISLRDTSSQDTLNTLNEIRQRWRLWPLCLVTTLCTIFAATQVPLPPWQIGLIAALLVGAMWIVHIRDAGRTTAVLLYDLDESVKAAYTALSTAFDRASSSSRIWHVQAEAVVLNRKYHAGASGVLDAEITSLTKTPPPRIKTNIQPPAIRFGPSNLYLFPDRILFVDACGFGAVDYNALQCDVQYGSFILDRAAPSDAQIIGSTWRYVNKDGGPDRRFASNPQLPVIQVADLSLRTTTGLAGVLKFANVAAGEALREGLQQYAGSLAGICGLTAQKPVEQFQHEKERSEQKASSNWLFILAIVLFVLLPAYAFMAARLADGAASPSSSSLTQSIAGDSPTAIPRALPVRPPVTNGRSSFTQTSPMTDYKAATSQPTAAAAGTYRVVNIASSDFLNLRQGPGSSYPLVRPVLAERLLTEFYAHDQRFHGELKRRAEAELRTHRSVREMKDTSGKYNEIEIVRSDSAQDKDNRTTASGAITAETVAKIRYGGNTGSTLLAPRRVFTPRTLQQRPRLGYFET
jgi:hypothetical protein